MGILGAEDMDLAMIINTKAIIIRAMARNRIIHTLEVILGALVSMEITMIINRHSISIKQTNLRLTTHQNLQQILQV